MGIQNDSNPTVINLLKLLSHIAKLIMVQLTTEQRVFIVLHCTQTQSKALKRFILLP